MRYGILHPDPRKAPDSLLHIESFFDPMVKPLHPWPDPPPANHPTFEPQGLVQASPDKQSLSLFFCNDLPPKSAAYKIMAAVVADDTATLRQLLADPANLPDFTNGHGVSPLMVAAARGNIPSLEILAAHPLVNLQRETRAGWTALHYATHLQQPAAVTSLLAHYADYTRRNRYNETAFDLAADKKTQEAFWQHKDFMRFMKKQQPAHPRFRPQAPVAKTAAAEETPALPAKDTLRLDFVASAARLALAGQDSLRHKITQEIVRQLDSLTPAEMMACCRSLRDAENDTPRARNGFDWDALFIETAKTGRAELIAPLGKFIGIEEGKTLNQALYHCLRASDAPEAVMVLLQMGADPAAKAPAPGAARAKDNIIAYKAFESRRPEALWHICLWADKLPQWKKTCAEMQQEINLWHTRAFYQNDPNGSLQAKHKINNALGLYALRDSLRGISAGQLETQAAQALEKHNLHMLYALYAESRTPRMGRGIVTLKPETGTGMMVSFLKAQDMTMARRMAADGYHLRDAADDTLRRDIDDLAKGVYSAAAQAFTQAMLDGTLKLPEIETPADRRRALSQIAARMPVSGRGFF